jgi:hypothetical protein
VRKNIKQFGDLSMAGRNDCLLIGDSRRTIIGSVKSLEEVKKILNEPGRLFIKDAVIQGVTIEG